MALAVSSGAAAAPQPDDVEPPPLALPGGASQLAVAGGLWRLASLLADAR